MTVHGRSVSLTLRGAVERGELPALAEDWCSRLAESGAALIICDVGELLPDIVAVEALARLELIARRHHCRLRLRGVSSELSELLELTGLDEIVGQRA